MRRPANGGNCLLAALPPADLALLSPHLEKVSLEQDAVVVQSGDRREYVYFPHSGAISFMLDMPNGATIATAVIGREGAARRNPFSRWWAALLMPGRRYVPQRRTGATY